MNPAIYREPMTMDDYLSARPITTPFGLYDCDVPAERIAWEQSTLTHEPQVLGPSDPFWKAGVDANILVSMHSSDSGYSRYQSDWTGPLADDAVLHQRPLSRKVRHHRWTLHGFPNGKKPSDVFREHIITCFIDDAAGVRNRDLIGIDNITWECDYLHSDSIWPNAPETSTS